MLNKEALDKEIQRLTEIMMELDDALASEQELHIRVSLSSALGQLNIARGWLINLKGGTQ